MYDEFLEFAVQLAKAAGGIQLAYFRGDRLSIETKSNVYDVVTRADRESEELIAGMIAERYPESVYANDVRFALGSFYCAAGNMEKAREAFAQTDYKALSAPRREQYDIRMGYVAFAGGDYRKAYDYFDRIGSRSEYADHARYKIDRRRGEREGEVDDGGNALIGDTEVGKTKLKHGLRVFDHGVSHDRHFALRRKSVESRFRLVRWYRFRCG